MKKIYSIIIAIILVTSIVLIGNELIKKEILSNKQKLVYTIYKGRNNLDYLMDEIITDKTMVVLGSSELTSIDKIAYPNYLYNGGNSDYYTVLIGRGNNQSLFHSISISALSNNIKNNKVVLILSPQWFTPVNTTPEYFSSRFSEKLYMEFIKNNKISKKIKQRIASRTEDLLSADELQQKRIKNINSIYLNHNLNPFNYIKYGIYTKFIDLKETYTFYKEMGEFYVENPSSKNKIIAEEIDYTKLLIEAENAAKRESTNNDYGIYDDYFNTYIKEKYESLKNTQINDSYTESPEYDDLKLFLDTCKDLKLEVMLVSIPVNGSWYDYTGFPKENRKNYYNNIKNISKEYNVKLADFSDREYEKYFLRDIMHIGWKGWVYVDEAIYKFYKGEL